MRDLAAFQAEFAEALLAERPIGPVTRAPGFAVYRNTSARGAVEALRAAFPTVDTLIGDEAFTHAALDYRAACPPQSPVMSDYGADFADFLAAQSWTGELPYLADVARLDRLWLECFLAPDPAARIAWLATPAMTIWQAHREPAGFDELAPEWCEEGALFTREGNSIHAERIDRAAYLQLAASMAVGGAGATQSLKGA
jgi:hypothetical protein